MSQLYTQYRVIRPGYTHISSVLCLRCSRSTFHRCQFKQVSLKLLQNLSFNSKHKNGIMVFSCRFITSYKSTSMYHDTELCNDYWLQSYFIILGFEYPLPTIINKMLLFRHAGIWPVIWAYSAPSSVFGHFLVQAHEYFLSVFCTTTSFSVNLGSQIFRK